MSNLLRDLHPLARNVCRAHLSRAWTDEVLAAKGMTPELDDTARDDSAQAAVYAKGRDEHGNVIDPDLVVTNSRPGLSWHNVRYATGKPASFAYHLRLRDEDGRLVGWPGGAPMDDEAYLRLGQIGEALGCVWGGRWRHPHDPCHYEIHPNGGTLLQVLAIMREQGDIEPITKGPTA